MSDDQDTDGHASPDAVDDSRTEHVFDRLEASLSEQSAATPSDADSPEPTDTPSTPSDADSPAGASDAETSDGGRLWDRFESDRRSETGSSGGTTPQPSDSDATEAGSTTRRQSADDDAFQWSEPEQTASSQPDRAGESRPQAAEQPDTDRSSTAGSTAFRGLLDRISHRIGSASELFGGSADESTAHDEPGSERSGGQPDETTASAGAFADDPERGSGGSQQESVSVEEVLNQIDLFGRATASSQVLLLSPTAHSVTNDIYQRVLLPTDGRGQNVLVVSAVQSPGSRLSALENVTAWTAGKTGVIEVGRSVLQSDAAGPSDPTARLDVYKRISNLQNLAKLGVNISHIVSQWSASNRPTVVGVHTLSSIQQYVGNETMFQFLFTLKGQLNSMGVRGFYHMDPAAHTETEINTLQEAFDIVVTVSADGSIDVR